MALVISFVVKHWFNIVFILLVTMPCITAVVFSILVGLLVVKRFWKCWVRISLMRIGSCCKVPFPMWELQFYFFFVFGKLSNENAWYYYLHFDHNPSTWSKIVSSWGYNPVVLVMVAVVWVLVCILFSWSWMFLIFLRILQKPECPQAWRESELLLILLVAFLVWFFQISLIISG